MIDFASVHFHIRKLGQSNPPISNYEPSLLDLNGQPFIFKYLYHNSKISPIIAGAGIAVDFVPVDDLDNGYIQISNTFANASASGPSSSSGIQLYNPTNQTFKVLQVGSNLSLTDNGTFILLSTLGLATSQSLGNTLGGYINSIDASTATDG